MKETQEKHQKHPAPSTAVQGNIRSTKACCWTLLQTAWSLAGCNQQTTHEHWPPAFSDLFFSTQSPIYMTQKCDRFMPNFARHVWLPRSYFSVARAAGNCDDAPTKRCLSTTLLSSNTRPLTETEFGSKFFYRKPRERCESPLCRQYVHRCACLQHLEPATAEWPAAEARIIRRAKHLHLWEQGTNILSPPSREILRLLSRSAILASQSKVHIKCTRPSDCFTCQRASCPSAHLPSRPALLPYRFVYIFFLATLQFTCTF